MLEYLFSHPADSITAFATSMMALISLISVPTYLLSRRAEKSKFDPHVILYVEIVEDTDIFQIVVKNIGNGVAKDISFEHSRDIPKMAMGFDPIKEPTKEVFKEGDPLVDGIKTLSPGEVRKFTWGQYAGIKAALAGNGLTTICHFKSHDNRKIEPTVSNLEIDSFAGTERFLKTDTSEKILKELQKISRKLS